MNEQPDKGSEEWIYKRDNDKKKRLRERMNLQKNIRMGLWMNGKWMNGIIEEGKRNKKMNEENGKNE